MPSAPPRGRNLPAPRDLPPVLDPYAEPVPESRQLPPHQTKLERITEHVAALSEDLREYVEIRIALVQRRVEGVVGIAERLKQYAEAAKFFVPAAFLAIVGLVFIFMTIGFGLGALFGSVWLGFLATTVLLFVLTAVLGWLGMRSIRQAQAVEAELKQQQRDARQITREQVQETERQSARQSAL